MQTHIRKCRESDLVALRAIALKTYEATFRPLNKPAVIDAYLIQAFTTHKIKQELTCPGSHFYFLLLDEVLAGYLKLNEAPAQSDLNEPHTLEIERIYVLPNLQGIGLGKELLLHAVAVAKKLRMRALWLGVWEENTAAIGFYQRFGFVNVGQHDFQMGDEIQVDFIMRKNLEYA